VTVSLTAPPFEIPEVLTLAVVVSVSLTADFSCLVAVTDGVVVSDSETAAEFNAPAETEALVDKFAETETERFTETATESFVR
jgi:hypothetical protein